MVCPHAVIRAKVYSPELGDKAPATFKWAKPKWKGMETDHYTLQVAPEDCTGCAVCVDVCPVKSKSDASQKAINMVPQAPLREAERDNWEFFLDLPEVDRNKLSHSQVKDLQLLQPLFEFSGACAGCGETPTSSCSPSSSATVSTSPTPRAAPRSMAATCPPRRTARTPRPRTDLGQLALRRQRGIRLRHAHRARSAEGICRNAGHAPCIRHRA